MAKVRRNGLLEEMSGKFGDIVFRQMKDGRTIIARNPDFSNRQFSQDQLTHQDRVKLAAAYGKVAAKENPIYAQKAKGTNKTAYNLAFKDWFHPPMLCSIRCWDGQLQVHARDDVRVARVTLTIHWTRKEKCWNRARRNRAAVSSGTTGLYTRGGSLSRSRTCLGT